MKILCHRLNNRAISFCILSLDRQHAEGKMKFNDIYRELDRLIGTENTMKMYNYYKGQQVNFPMRLYDKAQIRRLITEEYDGNNIKQLAKKFGYSERGIYRIVKESKKQTD